MSDDKKDKKADVCELTPVHLRPIVKLDESPIGPAVLCEVHREEDCGKAPKGEARPSSGPAKVVSDSYRTGYDRIFGPRPRGQA